MAKKKADPANGEPVAEKPEKEKAEPPLSNAELAWLRKNVLA